MKKYVQPVLFLLIFTSIIFISLLYAQPPSTVNWDEGEEDVTSERPFKLPKGDFNTHKKMIEADDLYQRRKFSKARDIYEIITYMSKGDTLVKRAQYQLANCYYNMRLYEDSIFEYEQLMRMFPYSQYNEDANYRIGTCWFKLSYPSAYDQQETIKALQQFNHFIAQYPNSELIDEVENMKITCINKLLQKKYLNAHIYYMMGYYNASLMYLNEIFDENMSGEIEEDSFELAVKIHIKNNNWDSLGWVYYEFGYYKEALDALNLIIENDVNNSEICYHRGLIYLENGMADKAKELLQRSIDKNNNDEAVSKARDTLEQLK